MHAFTLVKMYMYTLINGNINRYILFMSICISVFEFIYDLVWPISISILPPISKWHVLSALFDVLLHISLSPWSAHRPTVCTRRTLERAAPDARSSTVPATSSDANNCSLKPSRSPTSRQTGARRAAPKPGGPQCLQRHSQRGLLY